MVKLSTFVLLISNVTSAGPLSNIDGDFVQMGDTVHVEFQGRSRWDYDVERRGDLIVLKIPKLGEAAVKKIKNWKGGLIESVEVTPQVGFNQSEIIFHVKEKKVSAFDYLTDDPARLVVDFYIDEEPEKKETPKVVAKEVPQPQAAGEASENEPDEAISVNGAKLATKLPKKVLPVAKVAKVTKRRPAASEFIKKIEPDKKPHEERNSESLSLETRLGIFDGGDPEFSRFSIKDYEIREEAKIASQRNIYIVFPGLKLEQRQLKELLASPPSYEIAPEDSEENKLARLLLTLFNRNRHAVYLKTLEFFRKQFPDSKYNEIADFMEADVYYSLWQKSKGAAEFEKAIALYRNLVEKYPKSILTERTLLLVAYSHLEKGDSLNTLMSLQRFLRYKPDSKSYDNVRLTVADAYQTLLKPDDAIKTYEEIISSPKSTRAPIDATYMVGDVYFNQGQFEKAISSYDNALKKYPNNWKDYPNIFYNKAESLFWLGKHKESLESYREFLRRYPGHNHCGFAMTRLGELLEILGADQKRIMGAFLESHFRYRGSEGAKIARVRVISNRMKEMRPKELDAALKELEETAKTSTLKEAYEFVNIMISDGFFGRKEYDRSVDKLAQFYRDNPTSPNLNVFKRRIVRSITQKIQDLVQGEDSIGAIREYAKYSDGWLHNDDRVDLKYYMGRALEKSGVINEAAPAYREILNHLYAIRGTSLEKERNVFETLPTTDKLNLRLAAVSRKQKDYGLATEYLSKITNPDDLLPSEKIERVQIIADIAERKGDLGLARLSLKRLVDTWKGQPEQVAPVYLDLVEVEMKSKNYTEAHLNAQKIINLAKDSNEVDKNTFAEALRAAGDALVAMKKPNEAITTYQELLEKFESQKKLDSVRFRVGKLLFDKGDVKAAENTWRPLQENPQNVWGKIASERLKEMQFSKDYNKYIKRIPAFDGTKEIKE